MLIGQLRGYFSIFCFVKRAKLVDEECIEGLKDKGENENTKNSTELRKNVFKKWANERNLLKV